jgi:hypothetical protein
MVRYDFRLINHASGVPAHTAAVYVAAGLFSGRYRRYLATRHSTPGSSSAASAPWCRSFPPIPFGIPRRRCCSTSAEPTCVTYRPSLGIRAWQQQRVILTSIPNGFVHSSETSGCNCSFSFLDGPGFARGHAADVGRRARNRHPEPRLRPSRPRRRRGFNPHGMEARHQARRPALPSKPPNLAAMKPQPYAVCPGGPAHRWRSFAAFAAASLATPTSGASANQLDFPDPLGFARPFLPSSPRPGTPLRAGGIGGGIRFDLSNGVLGNSFRDSLNHPARQAGISHLSGHFPGSNDRRDSTFSRKKRGRASWRSIPVLPARVGHASEGSCCASAPTWSSKSDGS